MMTNYGKRVFTMVPPRAPRFSLQYASNLHITRHDKPVFPLFVKPAARHLALVGDVGDPKHPHLSNFFTYSGWQVYRPANNGLNAIIHEIESKHHHVLGISISTYEQLQELPSLIKLLKGKSNNPQILVLIGGPLYNKSPEKFNHIQADVKAFTPEESVQKLDQHLSLIENNT